ncbi:hypothetical protein ACFL0Z_01395 [Patescibacteria group bacterium]
MEDVSEAAIFWQQHYILQLQSFSARKRTHFTLNTILVVGALLAILYYLQHPVPLSLQSIVIPLPIVVVVIIGMMSAVVSAGQLLTIKKLEGQLMRVSSKPGRGEEIISWLQKKKASQSGAKLSPYLFGVIYGVQLFGWGALLMCWCLELPLAAAITGILIAAIGLISFYYDKSM